MSMDYYFDFFDREFFDPVLPLSWREFQQRHNSNWVKDRNFDPWEYTGCSLRDLICWHYNMVEEDASRRMDDILSRRTVRWTIRNSDEQFGMINGIAQNMSEHRRFCASVVMHDIGVTVSVAAGAYLAGKIDGKSLAAVCQLCGSDPQDCVRLTKEQKKKLAPVTSRIDYATPIYAWQGERACADDYCPSCLGIAATRRFVACIVRAWSENWPVMAMEDPPNGGTYCRDFSEFIRLAKTVNKVSRFKKPSAYRQWY